MVWSEQVNPPASPWVFTVRAQAGQGATGAVLGEPEGDVGLRWHGHEALQKQWVGWGHGGYIKRSQGRRGETTQGPERRERGSLGSGEAPGSTPGA